MDGPCPQAHAYDIDWLTDQLANAAGEIRHGAGFRPVPEEGAAALKQLCHAFNRVIAAAAAREEEQRTVVEHHQNVVMAFEELARDQARDVARQNEELRRQNQELREANRHKGEFLTTMSHELRTPLNAVLGFSELMLEGMTGPLNPEQGEYLGVIQKAGQSLLSMINDILDMAKIDAGRMDFAQVEFDLRAPIAEAGSIARSMAMKKEQRFVLQTEEPVRCLADPGRVRQVALNLMSNAVKFTPRGGEVTTTVRAFEGWAELRVKDNGIGIDPEHHQLIFEAFRQIDGSATREFQGTGLGLALVRKFVEAMGGTISLDSRRGEGSTFVVRLPLSQGSAR